MKSVSIYRNKCNPNWQTQYAYLENISNNKPKNQIHIQDYLNDQNLMLQVKNKRKKLVCAYGHLLTSYQSNIRKTHFKHLHNEDLDNHTVVYRKNEQCHKHIQPRAHTLHFSMLRKYLDTLREPDNRHAFTNWNTLKIGTVES